MIEFDAFERIINDFGPPEHAKTVPPDVIELYKERIPRSMIIFWENMAGASTGPAIVASPIPDHLSLF